MKDKQKKKVYLNQKQKQFYAAPQRIKTLVAGRGTGKTTVFGDIAADLQRKLPRAKGFMLGKTYNQVLTKFMPEILDRFEQYGYKEHISMLDPGHYVVCQRPPAHFDLPYKKPKDFKYLITFWNGFTIELLSFDRPDTSRGGSYDFGIVDEAALIDWDKFKKSILSLLRGNRYRFPDNPAHRTLLIASSMPWKPSGFWVVDEMSKLAKKEPHKYFYLESSALDNIDVLGEEYFKDMEGMMDPITYQVEILNQRIHRLPNGFYSSLGEQHLYEGTYDYNYDELGMWESKRTDIDAAKPLNVSFDFNAAFTSCIVEQDFPGVCRILSNHFVKNETIDKLVQEIVSQYSQHNKKVIHIYGGKDGHQRRLNSLYTYFEQIAKKFKSLGWDCTIEANIFSSDIDHKLKHFYTSKILKGDDPSLPRVEMHEEFCKLLYQSMVMAPMNPDFTKNKASEKDDKLPQERATHLSDCFDNLIVPKYFASARAVDAEPNEVGFF